MSKVSYADELHAVEISPSGLRAIKERNLPNLKSASLFDGYNIHQEDQSFDLGTSVHVLEHVEHERLFIQEITRVCKKVYIEVPLELTFRLNNSIRNSGSYGHINFYNPTILLNLIDTCEVKVLDFKVFSNSLEYEKFVSGNFMGSLKYAGRSSLLARIPSIAPKCMTYLAGVVCERKSTS